MHKGKHFPDHDTVDITVSINSESYQSFGGIIFPLRELRTIGLCSLIDHELGVRAKNQGYPYSEIIESLFALYFCGGDCIEDLHTHLRDELCQIPGLRLPSPDTVLRGIKELSTENTAYVSPSSGNSYNFNINTRLNKLMLKALMITKQLTVDKSYDFDYDNELIPTEKWDAQYSYKKCFGYFPGVATIGNNIVYIENRDGNTNVRFKQEETLERAYSLLKEQGILINRSRMDCGSYSKEIIKVVEKYSRHFYIRARKSCEMYRQIQEVKQWRLVEINHIRYEVASIPFTLFEQDKNYRLVITRQASEDKQGNLFTGDHCIYRSILTNDGESTEDEVIAFYNERGASERIFDQMNNDFGWKRLPCSFQNQNNVFMILTAMIKNFFSYIIAKYSTICEGITPTSRLKKFIYRFVTVVGKWRYRARQWHLTLFTKRTCYKKLLLYES